MIWDGVEPVLNENRFEIVYWGDRVMPMLEFAQGAGSHWNGLGGGGIDWDGSGSAWGSLGWANSISDPWNPTGLITPSLTCASTLPCGTPQDLTLAPLDLATTSATTSWPYPPDWSGEYPLASSADLPVDPIIGDGRVCGVDLALGRQPDSQPDSQPAPSPELSPGNFNSLTGYGLVDAAAATAVAIALRPCQPAEPSPALLAEPPAPAEPPIAQLPTEVLAGAEYKTALPQDPEPTDPATEALEPLALIRAPQAWAQGATGAGVVVAVIDSGLDIDHPELKHSLWRNPNEIPDDGIDNDNNGYIDDVHGWNLGLGQNNGDIRPGTDSSYQGHGTHVAGIIAAALDDHGNTGVAYDAKIMVLRLGDATDRGSFSNAGSLVEGIYYAVDHGANIINLSLGWTDSPELQTALAYAAQYNVITVAAAGNSGNQALPVVPARYADRWGVSVGASDRNGNLARFSNRAGDDPKLCHVLAPGQRIYSTQPGGDYRKRSGTSMATPFVSGVIALMLSANPDLSVQQIRDTLMATAEPKPTELEPLAQSG